MTHTACHAVVNAIQWRPPHRIAKYSPIEIDRFPTLKLRMCRDRAILRSNNPVESDERRSALAKLLAECGKPRNQFAF